MHGPDKWLTCSHDIDFWVDVNDLSFAVHVNLTSKIVFIYNFISVIYFGCTGSSLQCLTSLVSACRLRSCDLWA